MFGGKTESKLMRQFLCSFIPFNVNIHMFCYGNTNVLEVGCKLCLLGGLPEYGICIILLFQKQKSSEFQNTPDPKCFK